MEFQLWNHQDAFLVEKKLVLILHIRAFIAQNVDRITKASTSALMAKSARCGLNFKCETNGEEEKFFSPLSNKNF